MEAGGLRLVPQRLTVPAALVQAAESLRPAAEAKGLTFAVRASITRMETSNQECF